MWSRSNSNRIPRGRARAESRPPWRRDAAFRLKVADWIATSEQFTKGKDMANKAALVTGASSGIGLAIADMLGEEGYALTVAARRPEKLEAAAEELRAKGYDVEYVAGSLGDEDVIKSVVAAHRERHGRLDVLVNNA